MFRRDFVATSRHEIKVYFQSVVDMNRQEEVKRNLQRNDTRNDRHYDESQCNGNSKEVLSTVVSLQRHSFHVMSLLELSNEFIEIFTPLFIISSLLIRSTPL